MTCELSTLNELLGDSLTKQYAHKLLKFIFRSRAWHDVSYYVKCLTIMYLISVMKCTSCTVHLYLRSPVASLWISEWCCALHSNFEKAHSSHCASYSFHYYQNYVAVRKMVKKVFFIHTKKTIVLGMNTSGAKIGILRENSRVSSVATENIRHQPGAI